MCFYCTSEHTWYSVYGTPGEVCLLHHIMVSSTHSCSGLSTPDLVCFYSTSQHTQYSVHSTPQVLCPEWQMLECSTHPLGVCCTLDVGLHAIHQSVLWTLQWILCTPGMHTKYSVQCTQKNCIIQVYTSKRMTILHTAKSNHASYLHHNVCIASDKNEVHGDLQIAVKAPTKL